MTNSNRIIVNTAAMYVKMVLSLFVTFFTTRLILQNLGVTNFGVYNLVAGAVAMLGFVNGSMSNTVQRFLAYEMGADSEDRLKKTFSLTLTIHIASAVIVSIVLVFLEPFFFNYVFNIPENSVPSAIISYRMVVLITALTIVTTPYAACFNAHEHIAMQAVIDFIIVLCKLLAAIVLSLNVDDKLVFYVALLLIIQLLNLLIKYVYCKILFDECKHTILFRVDMTIFKNMASFIGWNMLESFSWLAKGQGIAILMNTFYGTLVNAAYGIGSQVDGQLRFFSSTLLASFQPQIYKLGGAKDISGMLKLTVTATKASFFMLLIMFCPFVFVVGDVLQWWLVEVPQYTERICILLILITLINFMSNGVNVAVLGHGDIKKYQLISSIIILVSIPIGYALYAMSDDVYLLLYVMVLVEIVSNIAKYIIASETMKIELLFFFRQVFMPCLVVMMISFVGLWFLDKAIMLLPNQFVVFTSRVIVGVFWSGLVVYMLGLSSSEKNVLKVKFAAVKNRINS